MWAPQRLTPWKGFCFPAGVHPEEAPPEGARSPPGTRPAWTRHDANNGVCTSFLWLCDRSPQTCWFKFDRNSPTILETTGPKTCPELKPRCWQGWAPCRGSKAGSPPHSFQFCWLLGTFACGHKLEGAPFKPLHFIFTFPCV